MMMKTNITPLLNYLDELFPSARCELFYSKDYELVIAVMLSAQTTDKSVNALEQTYDFGIIITFAFSNLYPYE